MIFAFNMNVKKGCLCVFLTPYLSYLSKSGDYFKF